MKHFLRWFFRPLIRFLVSGTEPELHAGWMDGGRCFLDVQGPFGYTDSFWFDPDGYRELAWDMIRMADDAEASVEEATPSWR